MANRKMKRENYYRKFYNWRNEEPPMRQVLKWLRWRRQKPPRPEWLDKWEARNM